MTRCARNRHAREVDPPERDASQTFAVASSTNTNPATIERGGCMSLQDDATRTVLAKESGVRAVGARLARKLHDRLRPQTILLRIAFARIEAQTSAE